MERLLSHGKTPGTKLVSSCGNKEGKRADRSATNKPRGNCACIDHPALILSYFKWLAASWPFLSLGRGRVLPECPGICYLCGKAPAPSAMWSHHCHPERDFAAGTEHFTPAQQQLGAQDTLGCPMALARWALILLFLWRTLLDVWLLCSTRAWQGMYQDPGMAPSFSTSQPLPQARLGDLTCSCQSHITDF